MPELKITLKSYLLVILIIAIEFRDGVSEAPSIATPAGKKHAVAFSDEHHHNLYKYGIAAREAGIMFMMKKNWFMHLELPVAEWLTEYESFESIFIKLSTDLSSKTFTDNAATNAKKASITSILQSDKSMLDEKGREIARRIRALDHVVQPAWRRIVRYHEIGDRPGPLGAVPIINENTRDIWIPFNCFSYAKYIRVPETTELTTEVTAAGTDIDKWVILVQKYHIEALFIYELTNRHIQALIDLMEGKYPATCISFAEWKSIAGVLKIADKDKDKFIQDSLSILGSYSTVDVQRTDTKLAITVVLPTLPTSPDQIFTIYTVGTVPVPDTEEIWREYKTPAWWVVSIDHSRRLELDTLEILETNCLQQQETWYCFEISPMLKNEEIGCWGQILENNPAPELADCLDEQELLAVQVTDIQNNQYLISVYEPTDLIVTCTEVKRRITAYSIQGLVMIELPQGCSAQIQQFYLPHHWQPTTIKSAVVAILKPFPKQEITKPVLKVVKRNKVLKPAKELPPVDLRDRNTPIQTVNVVPIKRIVTPSKTQDIADQASPADQEGEGEADIDEPLPDITPRRSGRPKSRKKLAEQNSANTLSSPSDQKRKSRRKQRDADTPLTSADSALETDDQTDQVPATSGSSSSASRDPPSDSKFDIANWLDQQFDFGDKFSLGTSLAALVLSLILIFKDAWKSVTQKYREHKVNSRIRKSRHQARNRTQMEYASVPTVASERRRAFVRQFQRVRAMSARLPRGNAASVV